MLDATERQLAAWGIPVEEALRVGWFDVDDARAVDPSYPAEPALVLPYWRPDGGDLIRRPNGEPFSRIRRLVPAPPQHGFAKQKFAKYLQPPKSGLHVYLPPGRDWIAMQRDAGHAVIITEGEAKAVRAGMEGFPVIALGGVWSFSTPGGALLDELRAFEWYGRDVYIAFDSDAADNPQVLAAEARLVYELQAQGGARCRIVRLPQNGTKIGLDDFLNSQGPDALDRLLRLSESLSPLDAKVVAFNKHLAWVEHDGMVYDIEEAKWIRKDNFTSGSRWSSHKHITMSANGRSQKTISVASEWLTHHWARRYGEGIFRPNEGEVCVSEQGTPALNLWRDTPGIPGPVEPFLDLTSYLFQSLPDPALPLNLLAYKAQHPEIKVPLALVLVGQQGGGKTLWGEIVMEAFKPYGYAVAPSQLSSEFQGWIERGLIALVNEAHGEDMLKAAETLKSLISDLRRPMNEKFRPVRQVNSYTTYIITSNRRAVGAYNADDRRMIVVDCPPKRDLAYYDAIGEWKQKNGPQHVMHWLRNYDLKGWRPPQAAPLTAEKYLAYVESLTPVARLAEDMRTATQSTILLWLDSAIAWARQAEVSNNPAQGDMGRAIIGNIQQTQVRPWYTPEELALMFPTIALESMGVKLNQTPAGRISRQLREAGIPYLVCSDRPEGFEWQGRLRQFLVVADFDEWRRPLSQAQFEHAMRGWPTYGQLRGNKPQQQWRAGP